MALIELDRPQPATRPRRRVDRSWTPAVVLLLCASVLTASARPGPEVIDQLWSVPIDRSSAVAATGSSVYVLTSAGGGRVIAYGRDDGRQRWSRPVAVSRLEFTATDPGAVLVPVGRSTVRYLSDFGVTLYERATEATVALDPATGAELWRRPGAVVHATPETTLLVAPGATARQVWTADGTVRWTKAVDGAVSWSPAGSEPLSARIVAGTADGQVVVLRLADGTEVSRGGVPGDAVDADAMVYANRTDHGRAAVTAYSLDSLAPAWQVIGPAAGTGAHGCGVVVCFSSGGGIDGLDPSTGRVRWHVSGWADAVPVAGHSRLLAGAGTRSALLDSRSGRLVADLGRGVPVWDQAGAVPVFFLRPAAGGRVAVDRLDGDTGALSPRGLLPAGSRCTAAGEHRLVCTTTGRLAVFSA